MIDELAPAQVDFKSADADFWKRYHAYRRIRHEESRPDDPLRPDDVEEIRLKRESPFDLDYHYEIAREGELLSRVGDRATALGFVGPHPLRVRTTRTSQPVSCPKASVRPRTASAAPPARERPHERPP